MDFLFKSKSPLLGFLEPFELLKLVHVSKEARKAAIPYLEAFEADPETCLHANRFKIWLTTSPIVFEGSSVTEPSLAGPLRLETIENMSSILVENFVVLKCERIGYRGAHCEVAIFNHAGKFVAYYELNSKQFYEPLMDERVQEGDSNPYPPSIQIRNADPDHWTLSDQNLYWEWEGGFNGVITGCNFHLFDSFLGRLSPTEVSFVLMHALSEDTRVIYQYVLAVFEVFNQEFDRIKDDLAAGYDPGGRNTLMMEWKERLAAVSYQEYRPQLRFKVGTEVLCKRQDEWLSGHISKQWYRQPDGTLVPYQVKVNTYPGHISVLADSDSVIKQLHRPQLRFPIGTEVLCMVTQDQWLPGRVVKHWRNDVGLTTLAPYRIKLDDGRKFYAPVDRDSVIKLKNPNLSQAAAAGTTNNNDDSPKKNSDNLGSASGAQKKKKKKKKKRKRGDDMSPTESDKHKKKKSKKKKHPNAPKRPATAFASWSNQNRERVKAANPDVDKDAIEELLSSIWKQLLDEQKKPFEEKYRAERKCYKKEKAAYNEERGKGL